MTELEKQYGILSGLQGFLCKCNEYSGVCTCVCAYLHLLQLHGFSPTVCQAVASHWGHQDFSSTALCPPWKTPWETLRWWELCSLFAVRYRWETQTVCLIMVGRLGHTALFMRNSVQSIPSKDSCSILEQHLCWEVTSLVRLFPSMKNTKAFTTCG